VAQRGTVAIKIIVLFLLIVALVFGGLLWFDYLGLMDVKETLSPVLSIFGLGVPKKTALPEVPVILEEERLVVQWEALKIREEELDQRELEIKNKEAEILQISESLAEKEQALIDREKSFNERVKQYDNRNANLRKISGNLVGMPPVKAIERLVEMDDQDIIDILRITDQIAAETGEDSITAYWLSLMPADRAAEVQRKMLRKPLQ